MIIITDAARYPLIPKHVINMAMFVAVVSGPDEIQVVKDRWNIQNRVIEKLRLQ